MKQSNHKIILLLGGARSGKSDFAQKIASSASKRVLYCATARPGDKDMQTRIELHRRNRPASWHTAEIFTDLAAELGKRAARYDTVIIDCITIFVANVIGCKGKLEKRQQGVNAEIEELIELMRCRKFTCILVSNEVGLGIVPPYKLGREYRDILGRVNQKLAAAADEVYFLIAGIPVKIK